jgi:hypothetical protein
MVCLRNICINTLHKGDNDDDDNDDDDDDDDNNNNNNNNGVPRSKTLTSITSETRKPKTNCQLLSFL